MVKHYDFRFDYALIKSFIGKILVKCMHPKQILPHSVTAIVSFEIEDEIYELTNEFEAIDFLTLDDEATILRLSKTKWDNVDTMNSDEIHETINKIALVNDHTILKIDDDVAYDMWDTKALIFYFKDYELCFLKQDCWFSQENEIYKGHNLIANIGDGYGILEDFTEDDTKEAFVERKIVEIQ